MMQHQHLRQDADLILVEMSVNDIFMCVPPHPVGHAAPNDTAIGLVWPAQWRSYRFSGDYDRQPSIALANGNRNVEAQNTFETLLRAILSYPSHPAVIVLQTFQIQQQLATGGDVHVSTCQYYDVPYVHFAFLGCAGEAGSNGE